MATEGTFTASPPLALSLLSWSQSFTISSGAFTTTEEQLAEIISQPWARAAATSFSMTLGSIRTSLSRKKSMSPTMFSMQMFLASGMLLFLTIMLNPRKSEVCSFALAFSTVPSVLPPSTTKTKILLWG